MPVTNALGRCNPYTCDVCRDKEVEALGIGLTHKLLGQ
jgi:hypothetical protein